MKKPTITEADFTAAIEKAVADKGPDYVYEDYAGGCFYQIDKEPSCIVGTALVNLGFEADPRWDNGLHEDDHENTTADVTLPKFFTVPDNVVRAARRAQITQDTGGTWGAALENYKRVVSA